VGGGYILAILQGYLFVSLDYVQEGKELDLLIRKKNIRVTILRASIDRSDPGRT
jgi:hypothetical protein